MTEYSDNLTEADVEAVLRSLLRAGCDLLADECDNLKASITMPDGSLSASPLDAWAVEKVAVIEDWIASVKAALYPATEASHDDDAEIHDRSVMFGESGERLGRGALAVLEGRE